MSSKQKTPKQIMKTLCSELHKRGFIVQYYEAYSTCSCYIKLDYGACYSIRVSDHDGFSHLKYRYNVMNDIVNNYTVLDEGKERKYYGFTELNELVNDIVNCRENLKIMMGETGYKDYIKSYKLSAQCSTGFWSQCHLYK